MTFATTTVEVAFASAPLGGSYTWTDITDYVKSVSTSRGRDYELDQMQAGKASIVLNNADGRFTPDSASSPYYPNVLPRRRIRIRTTDPLSAGGSPSTPVVDSRSLTTVASGTTATWAHTVGSGTNRALFVDVGFTPGSGATVSSVTYGGVALTLVSAIGSGITGGDRRIERWRLLAPAAGTANIIATVSGTTTISATGLSLTGVNQTTPTGTSVTVSGTGTSSGSLAPTVPTADLVLSSLMIRSTTAPTPTGATTSGTQLAGTNNFLGYATAAGTTSWAWSVSDVFAGIATPVNGDNSGGGGTPTTVFTGFAESWQQSFPGGGAEDSEIVLSAVDGFKVLGQADLPAWFDLPPLHHGNTSAFYPLNDASGSVTAAETVAGLAAAQVGINPSAITFGAASITADGQASVQFTPNITKEFESPIQVYLAGQGYAMPVAAGAIDFFFNSSGPHGSLNPIFFATQSINATTGLSIGLTAVLGYLTLQDGASTTYTGSVGLSDGKTHHVAYVWTSATSRTLYLDGAVVFTTTTAPSAFGAYDSINIGSASVPWRPGTLASATAPPPFSMARFGFSSTLSAADVTDRYASGTTAYVGESESVRMARVLDFVNWPSADILLDSGLSALSVQTWAAGSNALQLIQGFASDAAGYVFVNPAGQVVYHNRQHRLNQTPKVTFQESTGTGVEGDVQFHMDDSNIKNDVSVTATGATGRAVSALPTAPARRPTALLRDLQPGHHQQPGGTGCCQLARFPVPQSEGALRHAHHRACYQRCPLGLGTRSGDWRQSHSRWPAGQCSSQHSDIPG
jgi:hypothetical protein